MPSCSRAVPTSGWSGYLHLPRLIDKARLHRRGMIDSGNDKTICFDNNGSPFSRSIRMPLRKWQTNAKNDAAVLAWMQKNSASHTPDEIEQRNHAMI